MAFCDRFWNDHKSGGIDGILCVLFRLQKEII